MDFLKLSEFLNSNETLLSAVLSLLGWLIARVNGIRPQKEHFLAQERLEKIINPIFELTESYMYKKSDSLSEITKYKIINIAKCNLPLSGGILMAYSNNESLSKKEDITAFLRYIDKEYDQLCKTLGIPLRSDYYRASKYKFKYCFTHYLAIVGKLLILLGLLLITSTTYFYLVSLNETLAMLALFILIAIAGFLYAIQ